MHTLNIKVDDIQEQTKQIYDQYEDSLNDILDGNIDNIVPKTVFTKPELRQYISIIQAGTPQNIDILQLSKKFGQLNS